MTTAVKEFPILFNTEMVKAILDGRKTQTRRVVKFQKDKNEESRIHREMRHATKCHDGNWGWTSGGNAFDERFLKQPGKKCPYGVPGDKLWVRETFSFTDFPATGTGFARRKYFYKASGNKLYPHMKWKPSIFMPREACRIILQIDDIRVERVCDIREEDAEQEGVTKRPEILRFDGTGYWYTNTFSSLWEKINGKRGFGWTVNPWVWVVDFRRVKQ